LLLLVLLLLVLLLLVLLLLVLLLLGLFPSVRRRLMMTNHAARAGAEDAMMAGKVTSDSPDGRALQAASRLAGTVAQPAAINRARAGNFICVSL
jgi:hypothetical protein